MIRLLVFDFDGTILDTEQPIYECWRRIYDEHGCDLPLSRWAQCIGTSDHEFDPYADLEAQLGRPLDRDAVDARRAGVADVILAQPVAPGVTDYLRTANRLGLRTAVASSSSRAWVAGHLERLGLLASFDHLSCADGGIASKPSPDLYRAVLEHFSVPAAEALAFEDSPNGVLAAKRAGLFCVAVPNTITATLPLDHADLRLRSLADLPLERLLARIGG